MSTTPKSTEDLLGGKFAIIHLHTHTHTYILAAESMPVCVWVFVNNNNNAGALVWRGIVIVIVCV